MRSKLDVVDVCVGEAPEWFAADSADITVAFQQRRNIDLSSSEGARFDTLQDLLSIGHVTSALCGPKSLGVVGTLRSTSRVDPLSLYGPEVAPFLDNLLAVSCVAGASFRTRNLQTRGPSRLSGGPITWGAFAAVPVARSAVPWELVEWFGFAADATSLCGCVRHTQSLARPSTPNPGADPGAQS